MNGAENITDRGPKVMKLHNENSLDLVYVDAAHGYEMVLANLQATLPKPVLS